MKRLVLVVFVIALILTSCSYELSDSTTEGEYLDVSQLEKIKNMDFYGYDQVFCDNVVRKEPNSSDKYASRIYSIFFDYDNCIVTIYCEKHRGKKSIKTISVDTYDMVRESGNTYKTHENEGVYVFNYDDEGTLNVRFSSNQFKTMEISEGNLDYEVEDKLMRWASIHSSNEVLSSLTSSSGINTSLSKDKKNELSGTYVGDGGSVLVLAEEGTLEYYYDGEAFAGEQWLYIDGCFDWHSSLFQDCLYTDVINPDDKQMEVKAIMGKNWDDELFTQISESQVFLDPDQAQALLDE